jgi:hypothetical protein
MRGVKLDQIKTSSSKNKLLRTIDATTYETEMRGVTFDQIKISSSMKGSLNK